MGASMARRPLAAGHRVVGYDRERARVSALVRQGAVGTSGGIWGLKLDRIARLWNQGSVVRSWLLELASRALARDPDLRSIAGYVEDSGEGRWTVQEAVVFGVPLPIISGALFSRFRSRATDHFGDKMVAALRREFGGHAVKPATRVPPARVSHR